jgi:HK97 gp10 family phage protein
MKTTVKVSGLKELDAALSQFTERKRRAIGRVALQNAGEIMAKEARALVPKDTWALHESIDVSGTLAPSTKPSHQKKAEQERFVGPDARPYAHIVEFGGNGAAPRPYLRPAFDQTKGAVVQRIQDELWMGIEKAIKASARKAAKGK